jgi:hypothetical protein
MKFLRPAHGVALTGRIRSKNIRSPLAEENVIEEIEVINVRVYGSNMYQDCLHTEFHEKLHVVCVLRISARTVYGFLSPRILLNSPPPHLP